MSSSTAADGLEESLKGVAQEAPLQTDPGGRRDHILDRVAPRAHPEGLVSRTHPAQLKSRPLERHASASDTIVRALRWILILNQVADGFCRYFFTHWNSGRAREETNSPRLAASAHRDSRDHDRERDDRDDDGRQCVDLRGDPHAHARIDHHRQRRRAGSGDEAGDDQVVEREREGEQQPESRQARSAGA